MGVVLHWFLPTNGDSRTDLSLGNAVGVAGSRVREGGAERGPEIGYIGQIARSAEQLGFTGALTPTTPSHDPADWKYHHVGNFLLSNVPPPNHGQV